MTLRDLIIFGIGSVTTGVLFVALRLASAPLARFRSALVRWLLLGPGNHAQRARRWWPRLRIRARGHRRADHPARQADGPCPQAGPAMTSR